MQPPAADIPLIIGHRGASGYRPEHTESAYRLALTLGADAVEPDVVPTRDGVLVVRHENEISGTTNVAKHAELRDRKTRKTVDGVSLSGWFTEDFTWQELQTLRCTERLKRIRRENREFDGAESMLRLADVLRLLDEPREVGGERVHGHAPVDPPLVVIEVKHAAYAESLGFNWAELLREELRLAGWQPDSPRIIIECFETGVLNTLKEAGIGGAHIFLLESRGAPADEVRALGDDARPFAWYRGDEGLDLLRAQGVVDGVSVAKRDLFEHSTFGLVRGTNDLVHRAHERGFRVYTWTLRPENAFLNARFMLGGVPSQWGDWQREFETILASGVDGIFVDHPDLGVAALREFLGGPERVSGSA